ncbi:MAG: hypothetical protein KGM47_12480, partial [Acidobacteriota bacterium]|nr:hypothetical protein [Acidobacteriota bacterium]
FAKTHTSGFSVWAAIAHPTQAYGTSDWSTPTQDAKGQFYYDFWLTGNTESYCPTKCSSWTAPIINPPFCPAFGYGSNPAPASNPRDFGNLAGTAGGAWNFQADNGDYPFIGTAVWEMYPYSDNESYGFASENDNQYDGKEDVSSTACTGWEGYSCGGEAQNYGDALIKVTQANHQIWSNIVQWLGSH